jgi:hypothetical protein
MQNISEKICLIFLLVLVATSCMAQAAALQDVDGNNLLHHLINKRAGCAGNLCNHIGSATGCCTGYTCGGNPPAGAPAGYASCVRSGGGSTFRK